MYEAAGFSSCIMLLVEYKKPHCSLRAACWLHSSACDISLQDPHRSISDCCPPLRGGPAIAPDGFLSLLLDPLMEGCHVCCPTVWSSCDRSICLLCTVFETQELASNVFPVISQCSMAALLSHGRSVKFNLLVPSDDGIYP